MRFLIRTLINAVALWVTANVVPGIHFAEGGRVDVVSLLLVALIFGLVNAVIKPIVKLATCPFYVLTLGLFTFVVNALMLMLTAWLAGPRFDVDGFIPALIGSIVISIVSFLLSLFISDED